MKTKPSKEVKERVAKLLIKKVVLGVKLDNGLVSPESINFSDINTINDSHAYSFLVDWGIIAKCIFQIIRRYGTDNTDTQNINKKDAAALANDIHRELVNIPYQYTFLIPLPRGIDLGDTLIIDDTVAIQKNNVEFQQKYTAANPKAVDVKPTLEDAIVKMRPRIPKLDDELYLKVVTRGYVDESDCKLIEHDPVYLYKILFSLLMVHGHLSTSNLSNLPTSRRHNVYAYTNSLAYVASIHRPEDEIKLIERYHLKNTVTDAELRNILEIYGHLITAQSTEESEKLRNQILNSLYWYFEKLKNSNYQLKFVFLISAFDSFFDADEKARIKARLIANHTGLTAKSLTEHEETINELYRRRNAVIHGEKPMIEYNYLKSMKDEDGDFRTDAYCSVLYSRYIMKQLEIYSNSVRI